MQMAPEQGQFLALLAKLIGARRAIEVGVFTGYSALAVALALPEDGRLLACDVSDEWTAIGRRYWQAAGVVHKIELRIAPAQETLAPLAADRRQHDSFDFAFIDADKNNYDAYYELCLQLVRPGGLIIVDNVLWNGAVIDPERQDEDTLAIRALNEKICSDSRVDLSLVPIGDGMTVARKR
jgi:caffeoyl-CoA O-methyltransferase